MIRVLQVLRTFTVFLWKRDVDSWRKHRVACRNLLPRSDRKAAQENGE